MHGNPLRNTFYAMNVCRTKLRLPRCNIPTALSQNSNFHLDTNGFRLSFANAKYFFSLLLFLPQKMRKFTFSDRSGKRILPKFRLLCSTCFFSLFTEPPINYVPLCRIEDYFRNEYGGKL